ncbi:MAG: MBL fold metallo-hydrolase [Chloroflexi bacterium]|nr:MBL fold metallo-hydrolase [Chloroflexota bacterium]
MKLTILGSSGAAPAEGGACSGYLMEEGRVRLLLDCGTGVLSNLQRVMAPSKVTDIVVSHMHFDHFLDLVPFGYWRTYGPKQTLGEPPRLYLPPGGRRALAGIVAQVGVAQDFFERAFTVAEYSHLDVLSLGDLKLTFALVPHYVPSYAVAVSQGGVTKLVFSSDGGPSEALQRLAAGAALFLCEAALDTPEQSAQPGHMTAAQAAEIARAASVRQLVLTHFWPWQDRRRAAAKATAVFGERVVVAEEGASYLL